jgi:hypothetical protein
VRDAGETRDRCGIQSGQVMMMHADDHGIGARPGTEKNRPARSPVVRDESLDAQGDPGRVLVCRSCLAPVTTTAEKIEVSGAHTHSFTNPHGLFFDIGCFRHAPGCVYTSESSGEFTWFPGFRWQVAVCRSCMTHLGWLFTSGGSRFTGLILDKLITWTASEGRPS